QRLAARQVIGPISLRPSDGVAVVRRYTGNELRRAANLATRVGRRRALPRRVSRAAPPDLSLSLMTFAGARRRFEGFFFAPESEANLTVARGVLAATALWVVLSRFDLPSVLAFPTEMWAGVPLAQRIRFAYLLPLTLERSLYALLHLLLVGAMFGIAQRATCILSGLLLIHFAPLESILWAPNPYLRGLTIPALGLLVF